VLRYSVMLVMVCALVVGCGKDDGEGAMGKASDVKAKHEVPATNVWSGQIKTIDKAKGVEQTLMQSAQQQSSEIDKQSQ
jgi:hypothetical protein